MTEPELTSWRREAVVVLPFACLLAVALALVSTWAFLNIPKTPGVPDALEWLMCYGLISGCYLSLSALSIRHFVEAWCSPLVAGRFATVHALQLPIVAVGAGSWAVCKLAGKF